MNKALDSTELSPDQLVKAEQVLRIELAGAYRLVDYFGWCELIYGHLNSPRARTRTALSDQSIRAEL